MADGLLDINELATALDVKRGTIYRWQQRYANTPQPARVVGTAYLWRLQDWEQWRVNRLKKED